MENSENSYFRTYKVISSSGKTMFAWSMNDGIMIRTSNDDSIESIVNRIKKIIHRNAGNPNFPNQINIDFRPYHDIECDKSSGLSKRCLPLADNETEEFWKHFIMTP